MRLNTKLGVFIGILFIAISIIICRGVISEKQPNDCNNILYLHSNTDSNLWINAEEDDPSSNADSYENTLLGNGDVVEDFIHLPQIDKKIKIENGINIITQIHMEVSGGATPDITLTLLSGSTEIGSGSDDDADGNFVYEYSFTSNLDEIEENLICRISFTYTGQITYTIYTEGTSWIILPIVQEPPQISNIFVSEISQDTAKINWDTNELSNSLVIYWNESKEYMTKGNSDFVKSHQIVLTGLELGMEYNFNVSSADTNGNKKESIEFWFKTAWVVRGHEYFNNEEIELNTNLIIADGGELTFENVILKMACNYDYEFTIEVKDGGEFYIYDDDKNPITKDDASIITSLNPQYKYGFYIRDGATFEMKNSELHNCGSESKYLDHGLIIESDDVLIDNNLISANQIGLYVYYASPVISNNEIKDNIHGIYSENGKPNIINNIVSNNEKGITCEGEAILEKNTISNNERGIFCSFGDFIISDNTINTNDVGLYFDYANSVLTKNIISDNEEGIESWDSSLAINETEFNNNGGCIISSGFLNINEIELIECTFSDNDYVIISEKSDILIKKSFFINTELTDFVLDDETDFIIIDSQVLNSGDHCFSLSSTSDVLTENTTFDKDKVEIMDDSTLTVKWYLEMRTVNAKKQKVDYVKLRIMDNENGDYDENFTSDSNGLIEQILVTEYIQNETDKLLLTPYNITASKELDNCEVELWLTKSSFEDITLKDKTPPEIEDISFIVTDTTVTIYWDTNEYTDSKIKYGLDETYGSVVFHNNLMFSHQIEIKDLIEKTSYHYMIVAEDEYGNIKESDDNIFTTSPDATPPKISEVKHTSITHNSVIITWKTNEETTSQVEYGISTPNKKTQRDFSLTLSHSVEIIRLLSNQTYNYAVISEDANENEAKSTVYSFNTKEGIPTPPPKIEVTMNVDKTKIMEKDDVKITAKIKNIGTETVIVDAIFYDGDSRLGKQYDIEILANKSIDVFFDWKSKEIGNHVLKVFVEYNDEILGNTSLDITVEKLEIVDISVSMEIRNLEMKKGDDQEISAIITNNVNNPINILIIMYDNDKEINRTTRTIEGYSIYEMKHLLKAEETGNHTIKVIIRYKGNEISSDEKILNIEKKEDDDNTIMIAGIGGVVAACVVIGLFFWWRSGFEYEE